MAENQIADPEAQADNPVADPQEQTDNPNTEPQSADPQPSSTEDGPKDELPRWHHSLPDPLKGHDSLKGYNTIGDAAKALVELQGQSEQMVKIPAEDAPLEEREAFYQKIGRPETPGEYQLKRPDDWPANLPWSQRDAKAFAESAYKAGIPKAQAEQMHRALVSHTKDVALEYMGQAREQDAKWEEQLKKTYGAHVDENVKSAHRAMEVLGSPALKAELEAAGLLRSPQQVATWRKVWDAIGEDRIFAGAADPDGKTQEARLKALYPNTQW